MTSLRLFFTTLIASVTLVSCGAFEHIDSRLPTISQQDAYDVSWGIAPRKSRGSPKRQFQYNPRTESPLPVNAAPSAPASAAPAPTPAPSRAPISPVVPPNSPLR